MIYFRKVRWKNLLSTGNTFIEVDLSGKHTTLIVGDNGSGKSTMLDALCFGLFNKPFRDIKKDQLINTINTGGTQVEVEQIIPLTSVNILNIVPNEIYEIIHPGRDSSGNTLLWNTIDDPLAPANKIYVQGTRFTVKNGYNIGDIIPNNTTITTPAKIFRIQNSTQQQHSFNIHSSLTKVGSRFGSGFGIGNQGGNSLFSFKLNHRIKPQNNWNPLQLNNPYFNSKLYQKNDNHSSFPYSKFCNYRRRHVLPRFQRLLSNGKSIFNTPVRLSLSKGKTRY